MQNSNLSMDYKAEIRNLMERVIQYVKDRTKLFDNYIPCIRNEYDEKHAEKSIIMINETWINGKIKAENS